MIVITIHTNSYPTIISHDAKVALRYSAPAYELKRPQDFKYVLTKSGEWHRMGRGHGYSTREIFEHSGNNVYMVEVFDQEIEAFILRVASASDIKKMGVRT
jgi:hypothetical protein